MEETRPNGPEWARLYEVAAGQGGYFSARQAQEAGYSLPLLAHHMKRGRIQRARRGIFRLTYYPAGEHEDLVVLWLWSEQAGVFSHETALMLQDLSDALPAVYHLTLPAAWARRRLRVPESVRLYFADIRAPERRWVGNVPVTSPLRTLVDCVRAHASPEFIHSARQQILERGLVSPTVLQNEWRRLSLPDF
ncbi:type IV toxin-antitoxin system AbiEi family antitoxin domain-containing protein [Archangium sp.]|uniref:type IV toxin-antitoxin system AbiEi family antitoxin domain-containing protein n=1 Tax=Archangium sp. TaxID=1872627 RepID=UPI00389A24D2